MYVIQRIRSRLWPTRLPLPAVWSWDRALIIRLTAIGFITVLAVGLRVWELNQIGYNSDEAVYAGQAAAIAQVPILKDFFPIFRAHPLLLQFILALVFHFGYSDISGRLVVVIIGLLTVYVVYLLGSLLYNKKVGALAALFLAVMPYHVIVTRQVLLDGPLVLCSTLTLYFLALFAATKRPTWLHATGLGMGLTVLAKETGIVLLGAIYAFLALSSEIRLRIMDLVISIAFMAMMIAPFPLSIILAGGSKSGQQYLVWQLFRRPNHPWDFYFTTVPESMGILIVVVALLGLWLLRHDWSWRERLLAWWIIVPVAFFELWPTKGFQYLLPIAPVFAILASRTLILWSPMKEITIKGRSLNLSLIRTLTVGIITLSLFGSSVQTILPAASGTFIAGTGGVPGGREAGNWIKENVPAGATFLTIGPSMANLIEFYGHRKAYGLSVSANPLHRNPSYQPIANPDLQIRNGDLQYIVWDSYSADRSDFFSSGLLRFTTRYHGRIVHTESVTIKLADGTTSVKPVIIIYEVRP
jgi:4-amino-4-deoxy-L-arabinose transferase-like glycosyltransferase